MAVTTFQMLQSHRELHDFRLWRGLFICYSNGDLNEHSFETQFILNHTKPYGWYFFSLLVHYFCYSITPNKLESEFTLVSCCFMFMTLLGFMPKRRSKIVFDPIVLLSFAVNILARYPYDTDPIVSKGWRYLELKVPSFPSYVVGNGIEFCISFQLALYTLIPVILIRMAMKNKWRGSYQVLLPHLVTLSWLQYFALCSHNATRYGLYRATLALVGSVLFLPLVGLMSVILPVAALTKWIVTSNLIFTVSIFLFFFVICLAVCYACARTKYAQYTAVLQIILMLVAFVALLKSSRQNQNMSPDYGLKVEPKPLEWENFQRYCHQKVWEQKETSANAQTRCAQLENVNVLWEGTVIDVKLLSITNAYKNLFENFPKLVADQLRCMYGEQICAFTDSFDSDCAILHESIAGKCSLGDYDLYTYVAKIRMSTLFWGTNAEVNLVLNNDFKNFTLRLVPNDQIWFKGVGLFKKWWHEKPELLASCAIGLFGFGFGAVTVNNYYKNDGDNRKYKERYTVYRHDDPRVAKIRTD
ncbi:wolframin-like [Cylas formicarius]|uniref:wolframin-like n=1 Tax=Cylas formicarius TaxID=197179 RepID=UPI0029583A2B|nr:wolframin-like [Cylas formicarius]